MNLSAYYLCLLRKGPTWTGEETPEVERLSGQHLAYLGQLIAAGKIIVAGPVDDNELRGFSIYRTATLAEARALAEADPGVQAGRFVVDMYRWFTPSGVLPVPEATEE